MGALAIGTSYTGGEGKSHAAVVHTLVGITVLQFMEIVIFHGYLSIKYSRVWQHCREDLRMCRSNREHHQPFDEEQAQPVRVRMTFNELCEPVLENADEHT